MLTYIGKAGGAGQLLMFAKILIFGAQDLEFMRFMVTFAQVFMVLNLK
jgi:hypothetical protein